MRCEFISLFLILNLIELTRCSLSFPDKINIDNDNLPNNKQNPTNEESTNSTEFAGEASFSGIGLLKTFENLTDWAVKEERIFELSKARYQSLKKEMKILEE
jgi:hypothetical protein